MAANGNNRSGFFVRHRWLLWAVGIVGAVVLLASFMSHDDAVPIRSATVQPGTIRSIVSTNGKVEPLQSFEAHAPVGTTVKKLLVREGDHVNQGQLMVQLDDADARSQLANPLRGKTENGIARVGNEIEKKKVLLLFRCDRRRARRCCFSPDRPAN